MPHRIVSFFSALCLLFSLATLSGCAGFGAGREPPRVNLQSFRMMAGEGMALPGFEFGLLVINPNPEPLRLQGVAYTIRLDGQRVIDGVSNELPVIDGYDQATVTIQAGVNLLGGIRLLERLMNAPHSSWDYEFEAKLDPEGFGWPIRVREAGRIGLDGIE